MMALLTVQQAAARLRVSPSTVYTLCAQRKLGHVRVGLARGTIRIDEADLAAFLENCKVSEQSPRNAARLKHIKGGPAGSP
jgi:excisionase family DNA binding protein